MRKLVLLALAGAALMTPLAAGAQDRGWDDRGWNDRGWNDRGWDDRRWNRDFDRDYGRWEWRDWRAGHRDVFFRGDWRAPFAYQAFRPGLPIAPGFWGPRYFINDPWRYHLPRVGRGLRWVRHYDDVLLVDVRRGFVVDVYRGFFW
ncbi:RcnB family protein [Sphingomonas sp.]|uniref:RcnB family protein n=1 Tax=Sphingomonas sp. TaxID=28214 RepID=UPI001E00CBBA|nr:RcnB family protein [Sphingomonas sp.]MBX9795557.1 RcnB family protein [Sphingomonas sp.]